MRNQTPALPLRNVDVDTTDELKRPYWRKKWWIAVIVIALGLLVWLQSSTTPRASLSFAGYGTNEAGERTASFRVANVGDLSLRRWDFYEVEVRGAGRPVEAHLGPDAFLPPGETETIVIPASESGAPWRIILHFSSYNAFQRLAYRISGWPVAGKIAEPMLDQPELRSFSDWVVP